VWLGCLAAFVTGWISIRWLLRYVRTHSLVPFAVYLLIAAPIFAILLTVTD
jgi:undecaprenyl-diphosphatase